jgi:superfamily II DNA or RNA helicase
MITVTIAHAAVNARLHQASREVKLEVQQILSYDVPGAEQSAAFKSRGWDGRSSFLNFRDGTFPAGFVHLVQAHLQRRGYKVNIVKKPLPELLGPEKPVVDAFGDDPDYDYQDETVERLCRHGKIIAQIATGGGKSRIAKKAFARVGRPTLFLTTRSLLMYQMKAAFENDMGIEVSVLGDGQFGSVSVDADGKETRSIKRMTVGMVQTLNARLEVITLQGEFEKVYDAIIKKEQAEFTAKKTALKLMKVSSADQARILKEFAEEQESNRVDAEGIKRTAAAKVKKQDAVRAQTIALLGKFELVILEEAHEASGAGFYGIMSHCINAHYRLALTATPFMKDDQEANMKLMAVAGPVGIKVSEEMLIDRGILAKPFFKYVKMKTPAAKLFRGTAWASAYRLGVVEYEARNDAIVHEAVMGKLYGLTTMCLIQHKAHGELLARKMIAAGLRVEFIYGESDHDTRKRQLRKLADGLLDVLIGSTILDVGVDVPAVGLIILAGGGKAEVALRQRIGRGLRKKKFGPNVAFVVDFMDLANDHLRGHYQQRRAIVEGTKGFGENVIPDGAEFDYEALGFKKAA